MKLKICGITDEAFAVAAAMRGIDYLGLIFAEGSPRRLTPEKARRIVTACTAYPTRFVGVFTHHETDEILRIADFVGLGVIQLHSPSYGDGVRAELESRGYEVWQLYSPGLECAGTSRSFLVDGRVGNESRLADWSIVSSLKSRGHRVILAGAISAANIASAISTHPDAIDVSSSLETTPGVKSLPLMAEFVDLFDSLAQPLAHRQHRIPPSQRQTCPIG